MTRYITIVGFEAVDERPGYGGTGRLWAVWCRDGAVNRIWLYTRTPERYSAGQTVQV